ncbi:hypothetical protein EVAR_40637_1 [Eumeta japonica]|uniref:Uncharacterized protein n=1 Tax=Eumeta variegata TaxID=151549 RepID=A0A4C1X779_EUMVA|nr:hypothetical protein EVAR_40637_1 [Eumeta japonica]
MILLSNDLTPTLDSDRTPARDSNPAPELVSSLFFTLPLLTVNRCKNKETLCFMIVKGHTSTWTRDSNPSPLERCVNPPVTWRSHKEAIVGRRALREVDDPGHRRSAPARPSRPTEGDVHRRTAAAAGAATAPQSFERDPRPLYLLKKTRLARKMYLNKNVTDIISGNRTAHSSTHNYLTDDFTILSVVRGRSGSFRWPYKEKGPFDRCGPPGNPSPPSHHQKNHKLIHGAGTQQA